MSDLQTWEDASKLAYTIARGQKFSHEDAEDLAQNVVLELYEQSPEVPARGLVSKRTYSRCADAARSRDSRVDREERYHEYTLPDDNSAQGNIYTLLDKLTPKQRKVVTMITLNGYTEVECAHALGIDQSNVSRLLSRGLSTLKRLYSEQ